MTTNQKFNELTSFLEEQMLVLGVPGVAFGILQNGETQIRGLGVTNVNHPLPVTAETLFQIGSNTKTFTGTLIMMLAQDGLVELDRPVSHYLPEFRVQDEAATRGATVRHLLNHTAGWVGDLFEDTGMGDDAKARYVALMADLEQLAPFGHHFSYNNAAFGVAGRIIEKVTGKLYEQVIQERIFDPLGMTHSYFDPGDVMIHRFAVGHRKGEAGPEVGFPWPLPRYAYSVGAITCTVADLLRYAQFYLAGGKSANGEQLLTAESIAQLWSDGVEIDPGAGRMGVSWFRRDIAGVRTHRHGGATVGQISEFVILPEQQAAYAIFTNADSGRQLNSAASKWIMANYFDASEPDPQQDDTADLAPYAGKYSRPMIDIDLSYADGELTGIVTAKRGFPSRNSPVQPPSPPFQLVALQDGDLWVPDGPFKGTRGHIIRTENGAIDYLRFGLRLHKRQ
ncbi:MAG: beta-lactamase family protein [Ardenticatenales bacterium]|nr:beta-lactamase family protein [Ardenticatenales bacterium]